MPEFNVGDRVRCIKTEVNGAKYGLIKLNHEYIVRGKRADTINLSNVATGAMVAAGHYYDSVAFELATGPNRVSLEGEVVSRHPNGIVSFKLKTGEIVLLPEALVPVDPKVLKYRRILADFDFVAEDDVWEEHIMRGDADAHIAKLIAKHSL
jgi:hypothetical protein